MTRATDEQARDAGPGDRNTGDGVKGADEHDVGVKESRSPRGGSLADGFERYLTPPDHAFEEVLRSGLVTLDANVLLDFYRITKVARTDLSRLLARLDDRLHVSHQAAAEFWYNRDTTLQAYATSLTGVQNKLQSLRKQGEDALNQWAKMTSLPEQEKSHVVASWTQTVDRLVLRLARLGEQHRPATSFDTNKDEVLQQLTTLLSERVGQPPSIGEEKALRTEGARRQKESIPPGYMDKGKSEELAVGDYLLWAQVIAEAKGRQRDTLLVTNDLKEDWWHRGAGGPPLPRRELQAEFSAATGRRLYMLQTSHFLSLGSKVFRLKVNEASITDLARVGRRARRSDDTGKRPIDKLGGSRTGDSYLSVVLRMLQLAEGDPTYEGLIGAYRTEFPRITLDSEARRRVDNLFTLGLVKLDGDAVTVTASGQELLKSRDVSLLQRLFLDRVLGAEEVLAAVRGSTPLASLREEPPAGISATQLSHVLRWLTQLHLLNDDEVAEQSSTSDDGA
ncbi:PIN-like domain-containing protein [Blastococcus sp. SYSU DS0828]